MKAAEHLNHDELLDIAQFLQLLLYWNDAEQPRQFDPYKEWDGPEFMAAIAEKLQQHDLVPEHLGDEPKNDSTGCEICGG